MTYSGHGHLKIFFRIPDSRQRERRKTT